MVDEKADHDYELMVVVVIAAVMAVFVLNSYVSSGELSITGNVVGAAITENSQPCTDTDTGLDYSTKGRLSGDIPKGFYSEDRCFMKYFLREVYCKDNRAASHTTYCRTGCENGMCKEKMIQQKCGDGVITGWERCDGANLGDKTCNNLEFIGGTLSCTKFCVLNASGCTRPVCGNNIKEAYEPCDGNDLNNKTCRNFGFVGGTLKCSNCRYNMTGCIKTCSSDAECGMRICAGVKVRETCENGRCVFKSDCTAAITTKCAKEGEYTSGTVAPEYYYGCCAGLKGFYPNPNLVGGGALCYNPEKGTPVCKNQGTRSEGWYYPKTGTLLKYENCGTISITPPPVTCTDSDGGKDYAVQGKCQRISRDPAIDSTGAGIMIDTCTDARTLKECYCNNTNLETIDYACPSGCKNGACVEQRINITFCGDGMISPGEECDGTNLGGMTCDVLGFNFGTLSCDSSCKLNARGCGIEGNVYCGNRIIDPGEQCDYFLGSINMSCRYFGFSVGTLTCGDKCIFDTSKCSGVTNGYCGDNIVEVGEQCDGSIGGKTCSDFGFSGGVLQCVNCKLSTAGCTGGTCGDGVKQKSPGEECDGTDLGGATCVSLGFAGGTLSCTRNCTLYGLLFAS